MIFCVAIVYRFRFIGIFFFLILELRKAKNYQFIVGNGTYREIKKAI